MKKKLFIIMGMIVVLSVLSSGCSSNKKSEQKSFEGRTIFIQKLSSLYSGENEIDLRFYCNDEDYASWKIDNIEQVVLVIGNSRFDIEVNDLRVDENLVGESYHQGYMVITGELDEVSGPAYLEVKKKEYENVIEYKLGEYSIVKDRGNSKDNELHFECGGVVKTNEDDEVFNYGIIMSIEAKESIVVKNVDFGLDGVIIDNENYIVYDENTYRDEIYDLIDNAIFDKRVKSAYQKKQIYNRDTSVNIELKKGKNYIYFPLKYDKEYNCSMEESVVLIKYACSESLEENKMITNSFIYFMEMSKSEEVINKMFK